MRSGTPGYFSFSCINPPRRYELSFTPGAHREFRHAGRKAWAYFLLFYSLKNEVKVYCAVFYAFLLA